MAKVAPRQGFAEKLRRVLVEDLKTAGVKAKVLVEPIPQTKLHRVHVISPGMQRLRASERQDLVWRIVHRHFKPEDELRISMIYTVAGQQELYAA